jgi:restriction system protein
MAQQSLFQLLRQQPWWVSMLAALVVFWVAHTFSPPIAPFIALPFVLLAAYIGFLQLRSGAAVDVPARLSELRAMSWDSFSAAITDAYRKRGYVVSPAEGQGYDFKLVKDGELTLLQCRRWKVNQVGAGPVRELARAVDRQDARRGICVAAGDFSAPARAVSAREPVVLLSGVELVQLVRKAKRPRRGGTK